ncbi:interferon-induced very large GTPase 1 [Bombina bombina]|uniref:interferon-induced very large GTPase 1 n=1 Tax=Bombina bombina TaxID=8345 RepID=UPI00235B291F|nr:interferon-induced very large GTPase 1 [Bombina bombina]
MESNIKVAVRVRPMIQREYDLNSTCIVHMSGNQTILKPAPTDTRKSTKEFFFDHSFWSANKSDPILYAGQEEIFKSLGEGVLQNISEGYNACIIAYGQTGSGKTYSMMGNEDEPGLIPRICSELFNKTDDSKMLRVEVSYVEIYNEKVIDLLQHHPKTKTLQVREHKVLGPYIEGLSQFAVSNFEKINLLITEGNKSRKMAVTKMNEISSRSHAIFTLTVTQTYYKNDKGPTRELLSKVSLVDLAGSEKISKSGAEGDQFKETSNINKSLTALGLVISSLSGNLKGKRKSQFVNYRDSVLTWLLKNSLGGNSKTVMLATISPASDNYSESLSTLQFLERAKNIVNKAVVNEDTKSRAIEELQEEVIRLNEELRQSDASKLKELQGKLKESENLLSELNTTWEDKLKQTEAAAQEIYRHLLMMGISIEAEGIKSDPDKCYLINLSHNPESSNFLIYYLKAKTIIGSGAFQGIQLGDPGIEQDHCIIDMTPDGNVTLIPKENSKIYVNGSLVLNCIELYNKDKILLGQNSLFMINIPKKKAQKPDADNSSNVSPDADNGSNVYLDADSGSNVSLESNNGSNVSPDADNSSNVSPDAAKGSNIFLDADNGSNVSLDADNGSNVSPDAANSSNVSLDTDNGLNVSPDADNGSNVSLDVDNGSNVSPDADNGSNVSLDADNDSNVSLDADNGSNVSPDADNGSNISPDAENGSNVSLDADNGSNVTLDADIGSNVSPDADNGSNVSLDVNDAARDSYRSLGENNTGNVLKNYPERVDGYASNNSPDHCNSNYKSNIPQDLKNSENSFNTLPSQKEKDYSTQHFNANESSISPEQKYAVNITTTIIVSDNSPNNKEYENGSTDQKYPNDSFNVPSDVDNPSSISLYQKNAAQNSYTSPGDNITNVLNIPPEKNNGNVSQNLLDRCNSNNKSSMSQDFQNAENDFNNAPNYKDINYGPENSSEDFYTENDSKAFHSQTIASPPRSSDPKITTHTQEFSEQIHSSENKLMEILQMNFDGWLNDLRSECIVTTEECDAVINRDDIKSKIKLLIKIILQKDEHICKKFYILLCKDHDQTNKDSQVFHQEKNFGNTDIKEVNSYEELHKDKRTRSEALYKLMEMETHRTSKLTLKHALEIGPECTAGRNKGSTGSIIYKFLHNLMALNVAARNCNLDLINKDVVNNDIYEDNNRNWEINTDSKIHPLDILCVLLHCSNSFLQQEIFSKMCMCQFAVPLLLPDVDEPDFTLMLWAMRDIVKKWRPQSLADTKGFKEDNLVQIRMPVFSFVRLGNCNVSKSKVLNQVLSPDQQYHDFFIHRNMEGGNVPRQVSSGLVEICWYFPADKKKSDVFSEPVSVTNLRGDLESNLKQFHFLTQISTAVFIIAESINNEQYQQLMKVNDSKLKYFFIIVPTDGKPDKATQEFLELFVSSNTANVLVKTKATNKATFVKNIRLAIVKLVHNSSNYLSLENMVQIAKDLKIFIDENSDKCQKAKEDAKKITEKMQDVVEYKRETMTLQGVLWKELAKLEKEMCQMKRQGNIDCQRYKSKLAKDVEKIRKQQYDLMVPDDMTNFIKALTKKSQVEKWYFLKWMKFYLDLAARNKLSAMQNEYKEKCKNASNQDLAKLDQKISDGSLGVEHFMRELGQLYEAEYFTTRENTYKKQSGLPGIAADLLLDGFPFELIDGDASNIPLQWVTDVLTELDNKTGGGCRLRVLTVLGVQSTGKSTLLNTMFGLQFPVASGRCTRGAFMTLIKVKKDFQKEMKCDFILVIDTEGLKAPELASLVESYEHDNELATLVIGLSDITIINMAMENSTEMKDILQIVVHAFLRMKQIGHKPNCQFVHQNVSDVSAHEKNMRDRKKLLEQLNEMTRLAASMEKKYNITAFSDIMEYDLEEHNWYIPGLWHGFPPMAPVSSGYSENIYELKTYLIKFLKMSSKKAKTIPEFITWITSLWNSVKHENFIFSFRNSLVARAYNQLSKKYLELEWGFRRAMHKWVTETEALIKNQSAENLEAKGNECIRVALSIVKQEENKMLSELEDFFKRETELVPLIERYRADFFLSAQTLRERHERDLTDKCKEAIRKQKEHHKIQGIQDKYIKTIEKKVYSLLKKCKEGRSNASDEELSKEFKTMWNDTVKDLDVTPLPKRNIESEMLTTLHKNMHVKGSSVNEKLHNLKGLPKPESNQPHDAERSLKVLVKSFYYKYIAPKNPSNLDNFTKHVSDKCAKSVAKLTKEDTDYNDTYCHNLLHIVDECCKEDYAKDLQITAVVELELKLQVLGNALNKFQQMHEKFVKTNDHIYRLEQLRPKYFNLFKNVFHEKDEIQNRAKHFCDHCLKPALIDHINGRLGIEIVDDILSSGDSKDYSTRSVFQFTVLKQMLEDNDFNHYVQYSSNYEDFIKNWILRYIFKKYTNFQTLQLKILSLVTKKVRHSLNSSGILESKNVSEFLTNLTEMLGKELVISQDEMKVIIFQNTANIKEFADNIETSLCDTEEEIKSEITSQSAEFVLSRVTLKPQDELFKRVFGCGKQCPFCSVPCEAGGAAHTEHFASVHRPKGLGQYRWIQTEILTHDICTTSVVSNTKFRNSLTDGKLVPYKDYREYYPDWLIAPDSSIEASDYWKFVLKEFNEQFAEEYDAKPADYPKEWDEITKEQALANLKSSFSMQ